MKTIQTIHPLCPAKVNFHRIVFHGNQSLFKLRDFEIDYFLFFLVFYWTNLSLAETCLVYLLNSCIQQLYIQLTNLGLSVILSRIFRKFDFDCWLPSFYFQIMTWKAEIWTPGRWWSYNRARSLFKYLEILSVENIDTVINVPRLIMPSHQRTTTDFRGVTLNCPLVYLKIKILERKYFHI